MHLFYNDVALHTLGKVIVASQTLRGDPADAPRRWRRQIKVRLHFHRPDYASNFALVRQVEGIIRRQQAVLRWLDPGTGVVWLNQPAQLVEHDWPESPNAHGTYFQALTLAFEYWETLSDNDAQGLHATFQRSGAGTPVLNLGQVESFKVDRDVRRHHPLRDNRDQVSGRIQCRGRLVADPAQPLATRQAALLAACDQLLAEITASGRLRYGSTDQVVRVDSFAAEVDSARWDVPWSLSATYTLFPDEAGYAQAEFTVSTREDRERNEVVRTFQGQIGANSEVAALAKLAAVRTGILAGATWATTRSETISDQVDGEDGAAFLRVTFHEEFRRQVGNIVESTLDVVDADDADSGLIRRTYSGRVLAQGATHATAYTTALARARALGHRKFQFQVAADESVEDPSLSAAGDRVTAAPVLVGMRFRYEYRIKGTRLRLSVATRTVQDSYGPDTEQVSGWIVAVDEAACRNAYTVFKQGYSARLFKHEETGTTTERIANLGAGDVPDGAQTSLLTRFEFNFAMHSAKASGAHRARYEIDVTQDWVAREKLTTVRGEAYGNNASNTEAWLALLLGELNLGTVRSERRTTRHERGPNEDKDEIDVVTALSFEASYVAALSGPAAILQCELTEEIECSGPRVVPQPTAASNDVIQLLPSIQSGRRTVSGTVTATDETTALEWIKRQRVLPLPSGFATGGVRAAQPPRVSFEPQWVALVDGVARSGDYGPGFGVKTVNAKLVRARFTLTEMVERITLA